MGWARERRREGSEGRCDAFVVAVELESAIRDLTIRDYPHRHRVNCKVYLKVGSRVALARRPLRLGIAVSHSGSRPTVQRPDRGFGLGSGRRGRMMTAVLFIPGASHLHQSQLLVVADIKRAERVSCTPRAPMSACRL